MTHNEEPSKPRRFTVVFAHESDDYGEPFHTYFKEKCPTCLEPQAGTSICGGLWEEPIGSRISCTRCDQEFVLLSSDLSSVEKWGTCEIEAVEIANERSLNNYRDEREIMIPGRFARIDNTDWRILDGMSKFVGGQNEVAFFTAMQFHTINTYLGHANKSGVNPDGEYLDSPFVGVVRAKYGDSVADEMVKRILIELAREGKFLPIEGLLERWKSGGNDVQPSGGGA